MNLSRILTSLLFAALLVSVSAVYGYQAQDLQLPTASLVPQAPLFMLAGYWGCQLLLRRGRAARHRDRIALAVAVVFAAWPVVLLHSLSISLPLPRRLKHEEIQRLHTVFPHPFVLMGLSRKGSTLRIRRADRCEQLTAFIASVQDQNVQEK